MTDVDDFDTSKEKYLEKYGYHFTKDLANDVCCDLFTKNPTIEIPQNFKIPEGFTEGDLIYYVNYIYSLLVPVVFPTGTLKTKEILSYTVDLLKQSFPEKPFTSFMAQLKWGDLDVDLSEY